MAKENKKKTKSVKDYPWFDIKTDYLNGVEPKAIAEKYQFESISTLYNAIDNRGWNKEKTEIHENIRNDVENAIREGANESIKYLREVVNNPEEKTLDRISAAKGLLSVSGLEKSEKKITGNIGLEKIFITPDEAKETNNHIDKFINGQS